MKILIIGGGGREHAIGEKILENRQLKKLYFAPGNGGTSQIGENISLNDPESLANFSIKKCIDLTIVGSEMLLVDGIVDIFQKRSLPIFGPHKQAAQLEGNKVFAKNFMKKYGVRTPNYICFSDYKKAIAYLDELKNYPIVIKTSGLAFGKGVIITQDKKSSFKALKLMMKDKIFGFSSNEVIIEEYLQGKEASILSIFNGKEIFPFISAKDYKKIGEGETGLNTGGMGTIAPNPHMNDIIWKDFNENILKPTLRGLFFEKFFFTGIIFFGLMITDRGVYLLEYNLRLGDPETQSILPLMKSDFLKTIQKSINGESIKISWKPTYSCGLVIASGGYPGSYKKGYEITGIETLDTLYYIAGAERKNNHWITSSGRVLNIIGMGASAQEAHKNAYEAVKKISFKNSYYRNDIGLS